MLNQQITATINPDFGQAESDELVANFSAVETLYSDKRAFFTENQSLFDVKGDSFELLNTRRMGGSSDSKTTSSTNKPTDISAAVKYLNTNQTFDVGVMAVLEDDPAGASGKHFLSGRWLLKADNGYFGQLVNWVDRPTLDRDALTSGLDFGYWKDKLNVSGKLLYSKIVQENSTEGFGSQINVKYQTNRQWHSDLSFLWLDEKLDFNDMGYLARNDLKQFNFFSEYLVISKSESSSFRDFNWYIDETMTSNKKGEHLANQFTFGVKATTKANSVITSEINYVSSGIDDLISRGYGSVKLPAKQDVLFRYSSPFSGKTHYQIDYHHLQEGIKDWANSLKVSMDYSFSDKTMLTTSLFHLNSDDWLIGNGTGQLTTYQRTFDQLSFNLLWLMAENQELSVKSQWFGVEANQGKAFIYSSEPTSSKLSSNKQASNEDLVERFKQSQLSMQIRYRYRFAAMSDFYIVYVRNGAFYQQGDDLPGNNDILRQQFEDPDDHQLMFKIRMMF